MDSPFDANPSSDNEGVEIEDDVLDLANIYDEGEETIDEISAKTTISMQQCFIVLSESDIKRLQEVDINKVLSILPISRATACLLLYHYEWSATKVLEAWFATKAALERLHHHVENELKEFLNVGPKDEFNDFRVNLINLTRVTKEYFKNMVKALENGLDDAGVKRMSSEIGESSNQRETRRRINIDGQTDNEI